MNVANALFSLGGFAQSNEQIVQTSIPQFPNHLSFQSLFGQKIEQFLGNEQANERSVHLLEIEIKEKLEAILTILFGKTETELVEMLGEEITQIFYPILEELQQFIEQNEAVDETEQADTRQLSEFITMLFAPANTSINTAFSQSDAANQSFTRDAAAFYRLLSVIESVLTQQMQQKTNQKQQTIHEQPLQLQKYEQAVAKIVEQVKTILHNYQQTKHHFTDDKGQQSKPVHFQQQFIPFQQTPMDRIQQFEWRIQLLNETDSTTFVKEFEKILMSTNLRTFKNGLTELNVRIYPEHLGRLAIKLVHQNETLVAKITTQTEAAKKLIESQLHQLRHALIAQNIQIEKIEITTNSNVQQEQNHSDAREHEKQDRETERYAREEEKRSDDDEQSFKEWLESLIL